MVVKLMVNRLVFLDYVYVLYLAKIILRVESVFIVIWKFFRQVINDMLYFILKVGCKIYIVIIYVKILSKMINKFQMVYNFI